jgi:hypothetical protein
MRLTTTTLTALALAVPVPVASQGLSSLAASRTDRPLTGTNALGATYLASREVLVDLSFQRGGAGKGKLFLLFDPSTGFFFHNLSWELTAPPRHSWIDPSQFRYGVSPERLLLLRFIRNAITITESTEKAASMEDAEAKAIRWYRDRLSQVEARTMKREDLGFLHQDLSIGRSGFPPGFFVTVMDPRPGLPLKLIDFVRRSDTHWEVTLENTDNRRRAKTHLVRRANIWTIGPFVIAD